MIVLRAQAIEATKRLFRRLGLAYAVLLATALLMPFGFTYDPELVARRASEIFSLGQGSGPGDLEALSDLLQNLALFLPFGFILKTAGASVWATALMGFGVSLGVEALQLLIPGRVTSAFDVATNLAGALGGALLACGMGSRATAIGWGFLRLDPPRLLLGGLAAAYACGVNLFLFLPLLPAKALPWDPEATLRLAGQAKDRWLWHGTIHRIAFWPDAVALTGVEDRDAACAVDLDFRGSARPLLSSGLPPGAELTGEGLVFSGSPLELPHELSAGLSGKVGVGGPFSVCLWVSPAYLGSSEESTVLALGPAQRRYDVAVKQIGRSVEFFFKTTVSGDSWVRPRAVFDDCLESSAPQTWLFAFDGHVVDGFIAGRPWPGALRIRDWTTPMGILMASPLLSEQLTFVTCLFIPYAALVSRLCLRRRRGAVLFAAFGLALPWAAYTLLCHACGIHADPLAGAGIALGGALGAAVGEAWERGSLAAASEMERRVST